MFWTYLKKQLFGSIGATVETGLGFLAFVGGIAGAVDSLRLLFHVAWPTYRGVVLYVVLTYAFTVALFAGWLQLTRRVRGKVSDWNDRLDEAKAELAASESKQRLLAIQHRMAEVVRRHVVCSITDEPAPDLDVDQDLRDVLESQLGPYLERRLGKEKISLTVKRYELQRAPADKLATGGPVYFTKILRAIFRHVGDRPRVHMRSELLEIERSVVFMSFKNADRRVQRVIIRDTEHLETDPAAGHLEEAERNLDYQKYGRDCGFRSILAFPMRLPASKQVGKGDASNIVGFFSLDCPEPNAFDALFQVDHTRPETNDGRHLRDTPELEFFFGLADNLATLAMLSDRPAETALVRRAE